MYRIFTLRKVAAIRLTDVFEISPYVRIPRMHGSPLSYLACIYSAVFMEKAGRVENAF